MSKQIQYVNYITAASQIKYFHPVALIESQCWHPLVCVVTCTLTYQPNPHVQRTKSNSTEVTHTINTIRWSGGLKIKHVHPHVKYFPASCLHKQTSVAMPSGKVYNKGIATIPEQSVYYEGFLSAAKCLILPNISRYGSLCYQPESFRHTRFFSGVETPGTSNELAILIPYPL